jgi:aminoglycoside 3-N-acetyltransferase
MPDTDDGETEADDETGHHDGEWAAVEAADSPVTVDRLLAGLRELGLGPGDDVLVHCSVSALGWVPGGAPTVVDALMGTVTDAGTLVMPTHTGQYADPSEWENPPVPEDWVPTIRETMPAYRPAVTPTRGTGAVAECFRSYPGVDRSAHPVSSFAAWGARPEFIAEGHELDRSMGEGSPLARVYDLGGSVLLLGVGHEHDTSLHLAEYRADVGETYETGAPILVDGERRWRTYEEMTIDDGDFPEVGRAFETERPDAVERGQVGNAEALLVDQVELVDFAVDWFRENR